MRFISFLSLKERKQIEGLFLGSIAVALLMWAVRVLLFPVRDTTSIYGQVLWLGLTWFDIATVLLAGVYIFQRAMKIAILENKEKRQT